MAEGQRHQRAGDAVEAEKQYRRALLLEPANPAALALSGSLALTSGDAPRAAALLERAVRFAAPNAGLFINLGEALRRVDRKPEAVTAFRRASQIDPSFAEAHYNLGLTLDQLGERQEAASELEIALSLRPDLPKGITLLLQLLRDLADYQRAIAVYQRLAPKAPESAELEAAVANVLADVFRLDEARAHFLRALELAPESAAIHADYAAVLAEGAEIALATQTLRRAIELDPQHALAHGALVYLLPFEAGTKPEAIATEARSWGARHAAALPRARHDYKEKPAGSKLRIGYVSPDFRLHPSALFVPPLLREHDRSAFHVVCYSNARRPDDITAKIRVLADEWRDISQLDDDAAVSLIQADGIDILVDLAMHGAHHRLFVFARKPAPIQATWLAYPGTTGLEAIDYRLSDPWLDPADVDERHYSERTLRLQDTFWCYEPLAPEPEVHGLPAAANGHITFGCLSSFKKVGKGAVTLWARVLTSVPTARLLLVAPLGGARERLLHGFAEAGVERERIELVSHMPRQQYLETYGRIDCCLDTTPYAGGTTSLDALWMGVPMITLAGETVASRSGASLAHNLNLPELVARTPEQYVERAAELVRDLRKLGELRAGLRGRLQRSALMDAPRFARSMEAAYREMWARWCSDASALRGSC